MLDPIRTALSMACNLTLAVWMTLCVIHFFTDDSKDAGSRGVNCFRYFTIDSNLLVSAAGICMMIAEIAALAGGAPIPEWVYTLKFAGTSAVTVTLLTVLLFLGLTQGYRKVFANDNLYMHLIGPLIAILSFCFLERGAPIPTSGLIFAVLPTVVYGAVYLTMVLITQKWEDFYGFNTGGRWYVSMLIVFTSGFGISLLLRLLHNLG